MPAERGSRVRIQEAVAQRGGLEGGVELVGLRRHPPLVHLFHALAAPRNRPARSAAGGKNARIAHCHDRRARGPRANVRRDRVVAADAFLLRLASKSVDGGVDWTRHRPVGAARDERKEALASDAVAENPAETGVVAADRKRHEARRGVEPRKLRRLSPGRLGLVKVAGAGPGAGAEVERFAHPAAHSVGVRGRRAAASVSIRLVGPFGVRRNAVARGV